MLPVDAAKSRMNEIASADPALVSTPLPPAPPLASAMISLALPRMTVGWNASNARIMAS